MGLYSRHPHGTPASTTVQEIWLNAQALLPFIDPVTAEKVVFVNSQNEAAVMARKFDMDKMEACLGGKSSWTYNKESYSQFCRELEVNPATGTANICSTQS